MILSISIRKLSQLRHTEYTIREAYNRGHHVFIHCIDLGEGPKSYDRAIPSRVPDRFLKYADVVSRLDVEPDVYLVPSGLDLMNVPRRGKGLVAALQTTYSDLVDINIDRFDVVYSWSTSWAHWWSQRHGGRRPDNFEVVGLPMSDHLGAAKNTGMDPYILYMPFPFRGKYDRMFYRFGFGDIATYKAARKLADDAGCILVVKSRLKTYLPKYVNKYADIVVNGDEPGEPTGYQFIVNAKALIHHCSSAVVEAAHAGVPAINVAPMWWRDYSNRGEDFAVHGPHSFYVWSGLLGDWSFGDMRIPYIDDLERAQYIRRFALPSEYFTSVATRLMVSLERRLNVDTNVAHTGM